MSSWPTPSRYPHIQLYKSRNAGWWLMSMCTLFHKSLSLLSLTKMSINMDIIFVLCVICSKVVTYYYPLLLPSPLQYWLLSTSVLQRDRQYWPIRSSHGCVGKRWYFTFLTHINVEPLPQSSSQIAAIQAGTQKTAVLLILQKYLLECKAMGFTY